MESLLAIGDFFRRMYATASPEQTMINRLFNYFLIMALIIVVIIGIMVIYGSYRYRAGNQEEGKEPKQTGGNQMLEITWTVLPFLTLVFFFFITLRIMNSIDQPRGERKNPDIDIIAHQFWWEIHYPGSKVITANELHIPVNKLLLIRLTSRDVIHDWWVMELGRKMDAIPGRFNFLWMQADRPGIYHGTCGEYCGAEHAWMRIYVEAQDSSDYLKWLNYQKTAFRSANDSLVSEGLALFEQKTCANCHTIKGTRANSPVGPDLTHLISRKTLVAGVLENNRQNLERWIRDPQGIKPGARMPNLILNQKELDLMLKFMEELK
ncbi:MAG: cytochrome c oxidase subunit II [Syntrophothermus sp.]